MVSQDRVSTIVSLFFRIPLDAGMVHDDVLVLPPFVSSANKGGFDMAITELSGCGTKSICEWLMVSH